MTFYLNKNKLLKKVLIVQQLKKIVACNQTIFVFITYFEQNTNKQQKKRSSKLNSPTRKINKKKETKIATTLVHAKCA